MITMIVNIKHRRNSTSLSLCLMFLIVVICLVTLTCGELTLPLQIENRTGMVVTIYVQEHAAGSVEPYKSIKIKGIPGTLTHYLIEAKNNEEEVIYSKKFKTSELHDADWKAVTPSLRVTMSLEDR